MSSLSSQAGALLVGTFLASLFMGVATALLSTYLRAFPNDRWPFKTLAAVTYGLGLTLTCINVSYLWNQSIQNFGSEDYLGLVSWKLAASFPFIGVSCGIFQFYLGWRVWILSGRNKRWTIFIGIAYVLALVALSLSIVVGVWYGQQELVTSLLERKALVYWWWGCEMTSELVISSMLLWFIFFRPNAELRGKTKTASFRRFLLRSIESNVPSFILQIGVLVLFAETNSSGFWFASAGFALPPAYSISCLLALLSRASEDAVFAWEAHHGAIVTKAPLKAANAAHFAQIDISIANEIQVDQGERDPRSPSYGTGARGAKHKPVKVNLTEHEMDVLEKRNRDFDFA